MTDMTKGQIIEQFEVISSDFLSIDNNVQNRHFARNETNAIYGKVKQPISLSAENNVTFLLGNAGSGKSVVMRDLYELLVKDNKIVLAIKSDYYSANSFDSLYKSLGTALNLIDAIEELTYDGEIVYLLIDQIDALSQALSSDRKALQTYLNFIVRLSKNRNVRTVVSCRWYDYEYEPKLSAFKFSSKVEMGLLDGEQVSSVIRDMGADYNLLSGYVKRFLQTPLHLKMFASIGDMNLLNENLTLQKMYDRFWQLKIVDDWKDKNGGNILQLINAIDYICNFIFENQQLSMTKAAIRMEYKDSVEYMLSEGVLNSVGKNNERIQFIHQSLFDYVFARICYEKDKDIINDLSHLHQGIFIRARVKQYFVYLREADTRKYIVSLKTIFNSVDEKGDYLYRFHIQQMLLNTIGFYEKVLPEEKQFVIKDILTNERYRSAFIESVYSQEWFQIVSKECKFDKITKDTDKDIIKLIGDLLYRLQWTSHSEFVAGYLQQNISQGNGDFNEMAMQVLDEEKYHPELYKELYLKLSKNSTALVMPQYLRNILSVDFDLVANAIKENARTYIDGRKNNITEYGRNHDVSSLLRQIMQCSPNKLLPFLLELIEILARGTQMQYKASKRIESWEFYNYESGSIAHDVSEQLVNEVIKLFIKMPYADTKDALTKVSKSDISVFVMIAAKVYSTDVEKYKSDILDFFCNSLAFEYIHSTCDYHVGELLKKAFPIFTFEEQNKVVAAIGKAEPEWENVIMKEHQKYNYPVSMKGKTKAHLLALLPSDTLKTHYPAEWDFLCQWQRKGLPLKNDKPFEISTMEGAKGVSSYEARDNNEWISIMETVGKKPSVNFENPSMSGVGYQLSELASKDTSRFSKLLSEILENEKINIGYKIAIFEGLQKGNIDIAIASDLFQKLLDLVSKEQTPNSAGVLISLTRCVSNFGENRQMPETASNFLMKIATEYDDSNENTEANNRPDAYQAGINQVRGSAANYLVKYARYIKDKNALFKALECIATNGAVTTRSATLLELGLLIITDPDRCLRLTLSLIGRNPSLMSMPIHNYNPLLYYTQRRFSDLESFYKQALDISQSHDILVCILWVAWANGESRAKELCLGMLRRTPSCQSKLLLFIDQCRPVHIKTECIKDVYLLLLDSNDKETGEKLESILDNLDKYVSDDVAQELINAFVKSENSKYAAHSFIKAMEHYSEKEPEKVLEWMHLVLKSTEGLTTQKSHYIDNGQFVDVVIKCYNEIGSYSDKKEGIEFSMDLIDEILLNNHMRSHLFHFFRMLDLQ